MSAYIANASVWQESWDRQQEGYLPDREERFAAMLAAVGAVTGGEPPRLLDLAGGTGTISLRALDRFPGTRATLVDQDPVLLAMARSSLRDRATVLAADLEKPSWADALPHREFDAVLTATAMHWLPGERITELYAEIHDLLRPGGIFVNADHMPDDGLPGLSERLLAQEDAHRNARYAAGSVLSWRDWWLKVRDHDDFAGLIAERDRIYPPDNTAHTEWMPPVAWHVAALRKAGFAEAGVLWRGGTDAAVAGVRQS